MSTDDKYQIVTIDLPDPYYGGMEQTKFVATDRDIELLQALDQQTIFLGELYGKHSDVNGLIDVEKNLTIEPISDEEAEVLLKHSGKILDGPDLFYYIELPEIFEYVFGDLLSDLIFTELSEEDLDRLDELIEADDRISARVEETTGRYNTYSYVRLVANRVSPLFLREWDDRVEQADGLDKLSPIELSRFYTELMATV